MRILKIAGVVLGLGLISFLHAQTPTAVKPVYVAGDVAVINSGSIVVKTKTGQSEVMLTDKTVYKRASAENFSLATATTGALTDIGVGDKVTVSALPSADGKSLDARTVYFVTKADIAAKDAKINEAWLKRGIKGRVVSVDPQTNQINVEMRSMMSTNKLTLTPKENAKFLRYAQDSVRYDEAAKSSLAEVKIGDEIRALGDRSADGLNFAAEEILTGAFQTIAGTVKSVDAAKNEIIIKNLQTGKDVTVVVTDTSVVKRFPAEQAERMAGFMMGGGGGVRPVGATPPQGNAPSANGQGQPPGTGRGLAGGRGGSVDDMLERFPNITANDLKAGDMIAFSSTKNPNVDRVKAIKLLAGVEPFLRMAQATGGGQRGQGVSGGFTIPGLDGVGF